MRISAQINVHPLVDATYKAQKNLAYSVVQGINATAKQIQDAQKQALADTFTLRSPQTRAFLERQVALIKPFASVKQGRIYAEISVGQRAKLLLSGYESGAERTPVKGSLIAQPVTGNSARPNFGSQIRQEFTFQSMRLKQDKTAKHGSRAAGAKRLVGQHGTFTIPQVGVFLRTGRRREEIELLYAYAQHQQLPAKLGWMRRAESIAGRWLDENITQAYLRSSTLPRF